MPASDALEITVLGSGGPFVSPQRASSAYLVRAGTTSVLVDCGGGAFERLGRAGVDPAALSAVLLTHTHADHTGGLPSVVFAAYMAGRTTPLPVVGPAGRDIHPGCRRFTELLFGEQGAWSYLHTFDGFSIAASEVPSAVDGARPAPVLELADVRISAIAVPHGMMPSLAYRLDVDGASVTFSGDVEDAAPALAELARNTDLLVHDMALPQRDVPHSALHARPSQAGRTAALAGARSLLLSHVMPELEDERPAAEAQIRSAYDGPVHWASDLERVPVTAQTRSDGG